MKSIFIAFFLLMTCNIKIHAQCDKSFELEVDKFTGDSVYKSYLSVIDGNNGERIYLIVSHSKKLTLLLLKIERDRLVCFGENAKITLLFEGGAKQVLVSENKLNCEGSLIFHIDGQLNKIGELSKTLISDIRFEAHNSIFDFSVNKNYQLSSSWKKLPELFTCLQSIIGTEDQKKSVP